MSLVARRSSLITLALLLLAGTAAAAPVTASQAQRLAKTFWSQTLGSKAAAEFTEVSSDFSHLILLNREGGGFVILSADDRALPVLGYSASGTLDPQRMPINMRLWLQGYEQQVTLACQYDTPALPLPLAAKDADSVAALLTSRWDQGRYYNDACPYDQSIHGNYLNHHPYTGCTATATAQVMRYWQWPPHGIGSYSYSYSGQGYHWSYGTLSANFDTTYYDWEHMPDELTSSSTDEEVAAVSTLIYHCGVASQMYYDRDGSGAFMSIVDMEEYEGYERCAELALYTYFGYSDSIRGLCKDDYADSTWKQMLKEELRAGRPVIYQGYTTGRESYGHCFVLDGYDASGKFHVNWGWSGEYDGHFALTALNPDGYYNYSSQQEGLFYVRPNYHCFDDDTTHGGGDTIVGGDTIIGGDTTQVSLALAGTVHPTVWITGRQLHIRGAQGQTLLIADPMGRIICRQRSIEDDYVLTLPHTGIYLLRIGTDSRKIVATGD